MQKRHYPELSRIWIENARRTHQGLPLIPVPLVRTPAADRMRALRELRKRREDYERDRARRAPLPVARRLPSFVAPMNGQKNRCSNTRMTPSNSLNTW
jgi:hypothetical protein